MIKALLRADGELTPLGQKTSKIVAHLYSLAIVLMCFLPSYFYPSYSFSTPGIIHIGRLYLLLTPFNTLVNGDKVDSLLQLFWVFMQNASNVFLLYPLVLCLVFLFPSWRNWKHALRNSFYISLSIECTQLLLDVFIDAGRVFEVDDLWTNSLGGLMAFWTYQLIIKYRKKQE